MTTVRIAAAQTAEFRENMEAALGCAAEVAARAEAEGASLRSGTMPIGPGRVECPLSSGLKSNVEDAKESRWAVAKPREQDDKLRWNQFDPRP